MKFKKSAPLMGVLAFMSIATWPREGSASREEPTVPVHIDKSPTVPERIVGEYNLVTGPDIYLPHQKCRVDISDDVLELLQKCKNQRKGWLQL